MLNFSGFLFYIDVSLSPISFYLALKIDPSGSNKYDTLTLQPVTEKKAVPALFRKEPKGVYIADVYS